MSKHLRETEILEALSNDPSTVMQLARKLGKFWESGLNRRLVALEAKGLVKRKKFGKLYVYWLESKKEV